MSKYAELWQNEQNKAQRVGQHEQLSRAQIAELLQKAVRDNKRWVAQKLVPMLREAQADLKRITPFSWVECEPNDRGVIAVRAMFAPSVSDHERVPHLSFVVHPDGEVHGFLDGNDPHELGKTSQAGILSAADRLLQHAIARHASAHRT